MVRKLTEHDQIFDGFMHRPFNPDFDGWINEMPDKYAYPSVRMAEDILCLFEELKEAKRKIWELEKECKCLRPLAGYGEVKE